MIPFSPTSLKKAWQGEEKLWLVFWVYFVGMTVFFWVTFSVWKLPSQIMDYLFFSPPSATGLYAMMVIQLTADIFIRTYQVISVWRCASNTHLKIWNFSARTICISFALVSVYGIIKTIVHVVSNPA